MNRSIEAETSGHTDSPSLPPTNGEGIPSELRIMDINPQRVDLATHCYMGAEARAAKRRLRQDPGVRILTDADEIARIMEELKSKPVSVAVSPDIHSTAEIKVVDPIAVAKKDRWDDAVSKVVAIARRLRKRGEREEADHHVINLFEGLRDPDRRERTMQRVKVLYEEHVSGPRKQG